MKTENAKTIATVLMDFDFERAQSVMDFLHWEWGLASGSSVPDVEEIKTHCRDLLFTVVEAIENGEERYTASSGGYEAHGELDEDGKLWLSLAFKAEEVEC